VSVAPMSNEMPKAYEVVYEVPFKTMYLNRDTGTIITIWNSKSEFITNEEYKKDAEDTVELIRDVDAKYMISDHRENRFKISEDLQKWYATLIAYVLGNSSFEKCAVIITTDLNLLSALEEIKNNIENAEKDHTILYRFFNDFKEAEKWVSSK
jgi:hypothetical protein